MFLKCYLYLSDGRPWSAHQSTTLNYLQTIVLALVLAFVVNPITAQDCWLETKGTTIVNARTQKPVILRAVGLGNWGLQEGYMLHPQGCDGCPATQWQMKRQLYNEGQTYEQVEEFYAQWRKNFITKADIDYIASLGFNSVRLPMHYELFLTPEQRKSRNNVIVDFNVGHDAYKADLQTWYDTNQLFNDTSVAGFTMIDQLIEWCEANGMYIILDLHAAPGGQGSNIDIADVFHENNLWTFPVFQDVTTRLWERLSQRYKAQPRIAAYDLINEPNNVPGSGQTIHPLMQRLISTVRDQGDNHMLIIEGDGWGNNYNWLEPFTFSPNWGLIYSAHRYWIDPQDDWKPDGNPNQINRMIDLINFRERHQVPVWVGETGENNNEWLSRNINRLEDVGIGWCHWTYKRHDVVENAALMRIGGNYLTDGAEILPVVLEAIKFENCIKNTNTIAAVTKRNPAPGTTGCVPGNSPSIPFGKNIWLKGNNGKYVSSQNGLSPMTCDKDFVDNWEIFTVVDANNGQIALRSNGKYVSCENGENPINCNRDKVEGWEIFDWEFTADGKVGFKGFNGRYISSQNGDAPMTCTSETLSGWEAFEWEVVNTLSFKTETTDKALSTVYPNPSSNGTFTVRVTSPSQVTIHAISGKRIGTYDLQSKQEISGLPTGLYIISVQNKNVKEVVKLLVQ